MFSSGGSSVGFAINQALVLSRKTASWSNREKALTNMDGTRFRCNAMMIGLLERHRCD